MISRPKLAVDICNTLADLDSEIVKLGVVKADCRQYEYPISSDWFMKNRQVFRNAKPIVGSVAAIQYISRIVDIIYLTARPMELNEVTKWWLRSYGYAAGELVHTCDKASYCNEYGIFKAIDDSPYEINNYINGGVKVLAPEKDYNEFYQYRFKWTDIKSVLSFVKEAC